MGRHYAIAFVVFIYRGDDLQSSQLIGVTIWSTLIIQMCFEVILYLAMAPIFTLECFIYLISTGKDIFNNREVGSE